MPFPSQCMPHAGSVHLCKISYDHPKCIAQVLSKFIKIQQTHALCMSAFCTSAFVLASVHAAKSSNKVLIASCGAINDIFDSHLFWNCDGCKENQRSRLQTFQWLSTEATWRDWPKTTSKSGTVFVRMQCLCALQRGTHFMLCYWMWVLFPTRIWKLPLHRFQFLLPKRWSMMGEGLAELAARGQELGLG